MHRFLSSRRSEQASNLGHLEIAVMEILWDRGESNVHDVVARLSRPVAYTTAMTTVDRLFKKGLLDRRKSERAFLYSPRVSRRVWEHQRVGHLVAQLSKESLISCLVDVVGEQNEDILEELERKIRMKRQELAERRIP
jgi:predicted transcriptional regulator